MFPHTKNYNDQSSLPTNFSNNLKVDKLTRQIIYSQNQFSILDVCNGNIIANGLDRFFYLSQHESNGVV
ncbi:hypothetical protein RINTHM_14370 [Richelia intracellularis HM01]|nr:hypothetical protein RINTHM_14370 [Richelia intracellularis HM01]